MAQPLGDGEEPGQPRGIRRFSKQVTLTRLSVIVGMIASLVGIAAAFGLLGGDGDSQPSAGRTQDGTTPTASKPVAGAVYSGKTDQGESIHFRVYVDGRTLRDLTVPLMGECSDGGPFTSTYRQGEATSFIITGGVLSGSSSIRGVTGRIVGGIFRLDARFEDSGRVARGTVSEHAKISDGSTCDTRQIKFTATTPSG
jgi:hypothetical protein